MFPIYSETEFLDWVYAQPNDRPVDISAPFYSPDCLACILGAFFKDHGFPKGWVSTSGRLTSEKHRLDLARITLSRGSIFEYLAPPTDVTETARMTFGSVQDRMDAVGVRPYAHLASDE